MEPQNSPNPFHAGPASCDRCGNQLPKWQTWAVGTQQPRVKCEKCEKLSKIVKINKRIQKTQNLIRNMR